MKYETRLIVGEVQFPVRMMGDNWENLFDLSERADSAKEGDGFKHDEHIETKRGKGGDLGDRRQSIVNRVSRPNLNSKAPLLLATPFIRVRNQLPSRPFLSSLLFSSFQFL